MTLENKAIEGELESCKAEIKEKEDQLEKIYLQLSKSKQKPEIVDAIPEP